MSILMGCAESATSNPMTANGFVDVRAATLRSIAAVPVTTKTGYSTSTCLFVLPPRNCANRSTLQARCADSTRPTRDSAGRYLQPQPNQSEPTSLSVLQPQSLMHMRDLTEAHRPALVSTADAAVLLAGSSSHVLALPHSERAATSASARPTRPRSRPSTRPARPCSRTGQARSSLPSPRPSAPRTSATVLDARVWRASGGLHAPASPRRDAAREPVLCRTPPRRVLRRGLCGDDGLLPPILSVGRAVLRGEADGRGGGGAAPCQERGGRYRMAA
ncbi:hypothetical protein BD413DRAFT_505253 [Trametes elegans]|nr:hypothetical protein BD413DRAFT_505253 [Trametes elegans]